MKDIPTQIDGVTSLAAADFNQIPDELENLITKSGLTLDGLDLDQVSKAISIYSAGGAFYTDSGVVNAYVLSAVGTKLAPEAYFDGMKIGFFLSTPNTGASTVNVNGIGVKNIVDSTGAALVGGELDDYVECVYILSSDHFRLIHTNTNFPGLQKQLAQAWVDFVGTGTISINDQHNVSSLVDNGTGDYTINFTTSFATTDYVAVVTATDGTAIFATGTTKTVSSFRFRFVTSGGAANDADIASVLIFGGL